MNFKRILRATLVAGLSAAALGAQAQVTVGVILSSTGPAASLGILEKNGVALAAAASAQKYRLIYLDDATDPSEATRLARKLIAEDKVDAIIGTTATPASLAVIEAVGEGQTPTISLAPSNALVTPVQGARRWMFKTTTNDDHEANPLFAHMKAQGVKSLGFIGFTDSYGEHWLQMTRQLGAAQQLQVVAEERYARTDASVASQVLKIVARSPDAVLIAGSGGAAATPLLELKKRGYKGRIYVTLGATFGDFLKISGADAEGVYAPFAAVMSVAQVPDANPAKRGANDFVQAYEAKYGTGTASVFAASAWDAVKLLDAAVPVAAKVAAPGTPAFREALRNALETLQNLVASRGIYTTSPQDHTGLDARALQVGRFEKGRWWLQN